MADGHTDWKQIFAGEELLVLCTEANAPAWNVYSVPGGRGLVLGTLFRRRDARPCDDHELYGPCCIKQPRAALQTLSSEYWGRYVAFLYDPEAHAVSVFRDPMGGLPCFYANVEGITVIFSFLEDCLANRLMPLDINWQFVRDHVANLDGNPSTTGICGVVELSSGECLTLAGNRAPHVERVWSPEALAQSVCEQDSRSLEEELRELTKACVGAWTGLHTRILHRLSGGLDSSIVASCMSIAARRGSTEITCINYHDEGGPGDERVHARLVAKANGLQLLERLNRADINLEPAFDARSFPRPVDYQGCVRRRQMEGHLFQELGISACTAGFGGDQLFFQRPVPLAAADCLLRYGLTQPFLKYAWRVAEQQSISVWRVLKIAAAALYSREDASLAHPRPNTWYVAADLVNDANARRTDAERRPRTSVPPAKQLHLRIRRLHAVPYATAGRGRWPDAVLPLLSQPLVEFCLRTPVFLLAADGMDRGLARKAFRDAVPEPILQRTRKGSTDHQLERLLTFNLSFLRETLLDGNLVRHDLLDKRKVELGLRSVAPAGRHAGELICRHLNTEVWLSRALKQPSQGRP